MASKTKSTNVTKQKKVYVKSESAFEEMQANGQLEPYTEYYTPDDTDAVFMPVGAIFSSAIPQTDARVHLLDGSTISQTGMYAEFATLLKTLVSKYAISCSAGAYESDLANFGQCGKFVIDNVAGTIRLPKITKFVEGLTSLANIGQSFSAGLPNIKGQFQKDTILVGNPDLATGPFSLYHSQNWNVRDGGGTNPIHQVTFDANKANSIYKDDVTTVQPQSTAYPYYIVLAGGYKSAEQVNIDAIASDLALIKTRYVTETYRSGSTWYIIYNDGWKECGGTSENIGNSSTGSKITLPLPNGFSDTNYTLLTTVFTNANSKDNSGNSAVPLAITTNSFNVSLQWVSANSSGYFAGKIKWYACGY